MRPTPLLALLLAGCSTFGGSPEPPAPPGEVLVRAEKALESERPDQAWVQLDRLDEEELQAEHLERFLFYRALACYQSNNHWECFKQLQTLSSRFPVTRFAGRIAWMEFQLGRSLLTARGGLFGIFSYHSYGLEVLRHLTITWPDQTEPGRPENIIADDALALLADLRWQDGDWHGAIDRYSQLVTSYPQSEWSTLAYFRIAMSWYQLIEGVPYDQRSMQKAEQELAQFLTSGKGTPGQLQEAQQALEQTREMLASRSLQTAEYYMTIGCPRGVVLHLQEAVDLYPKTRAAAQALETLPRWQEKAVQTGGSPARKEEEG